MTVIAFSTSAVARLKKIAMGRVSVFIAVAPASVTVAPNSPTARAHVKIPAAISPFPESGSVTLKNARNLLHPSVLATS